MWGHMTSPNIANTHESCYVCTWKIALRVFQNCRLMSVIALILCCGSAIAFSQTRSAFASDLTPELVGVLGFTCFVGVNSQN
jgi:hypothetical protein